MTDETYLAIQLWAIVVLPVVDLVMLLVGHPEFGSIDVQLN